MPVNGRTCAVGGVAVGIPSDHTLMLVPNEKIDDIVAIKECAHPCTPPCFTFFEPILILFITLLTTASLCIYAGLIKVCM